VNWNSNPKLCHSDRSIAIGLIQRNAEWRNLFSSAASGTPKLPQTNLGH
jgi:hypothetical protein